MKILVIKLRAMGDTVITTASLNVIRDHFGQKNIKSENHPETPFEIHCLVPEKWSSLLEEHPACDKIISWPNVRSSIRPKKSKIKNILSYGWKLRKEKYDLVFALHASTTTAWLARLTGCKNRAIHFHGVKDKNLFSTVKIIGKGKVKPIIERDLDTVRSLLPLDELKDQPTDSSFAKTSIAINSDENKKAKKYLSELDENWQETPVLAIGLGASRPTKIWSVDNYLQVAKDWSDKGGMVLVFISSNEKHLAVNFFKDEVHNKNIHVLIDLPLRQMAALLKQTKLFLGNDSGPKHLAVALGVKTVTIFGPENPYEWHPYDTSEHKTFFIEKLSCRKAPQIGWTPWCGLQTCEKEKHRCMKEISSEKVSKVCLNNFLQ